MSSKQSPLINILTARLPRQLAVQIYSEYEERMKEVIFILRNGERFTDLRDDVTTIELLLAMSIFHKRVISNLDAAVKFYRTVTWVYFCKINKYDYL